MPNLSVSVASLLSALNIGAVAGGGAGQEKSSAAGADSFSALLDIGKATDNAAAPSYDGADSQGRNDKDFQDKGTKTPVAAHVDGQQQIERPRLPERRDDNSHVDAARAANDGDKKDVNSQDAQKQPSATDKSQAAEKPAAKTADPKKAPDSANDNAPKADGKSSATQPDIAQEEQDLRDKLQAKLGDISQILLSIVQAYGAASAASQNNGPANNADAGLAVGADTSGVDLLKQIGAIVQQLQVLLQSDGKQTADGQAGAQADALQAGVGGQGAVGQGEQALINLTGALQADVAKLSALVQQNKTANIAPSLVLLQSQTQQSADDVQPLSADEIKSVLKSAIAQVKDGLQKLRGQNEKFFADARSTFDAPQAVSNPVQPIAKDPLLTPKAIVDVAFEPKAKDSIVVDSAPVIVAPIPPHVTNVANAAALSAAAQQVVAAQEDSSNFAGNSGSGNNQGQGASSSSAPVAASPLSAPDATAKSEFAKALNQAARTPVLEQVVFNIKKAAADGSSKISIQLDPVELGKLDIKIHVAADGKTGVVITADNKSTLDMLQRDSQGLTRALNDAGLQADSGSLSFNLRGGEGGNQQGQDNSQAASTYKKSQPEDELDVAINAISRSYTVTLADGLDIKI